MKLAGSCAAQVETTLLSVRDGSVLSLWIACGVGFLFGFDKVTNPGASVCSHLSIGWGRCYNETLGVRPHPHSFSLRSPELLV